LAVALASVQLEDASGKVIASAKADENGNYVFNAVPAGSYKLRFSQIGFQPIDQGPATVESGKATTVNVSLKVARVEEQITVVADALTALEPTGSRLDLAPIETPASIVEVNDATMASRGYLQIEDAVASMPGATSGGSPAAPSQFVARGFAGNQVTLLRDGIYFGAAGMTNRPQNSFNVASVDLLAGPASVLYGQGAVGGVVNVLTKQPVFDKITYEGLASYGSFGTYNLGGGAGGQINRHLAFRADVSEYRSDGYVKDSNPGAFNVTGGLLWKVSDRLNVRLSTDMEKDDVSSYYGTPLVPASFGTDPLKGVIESKAGKVLDARMRYNNYNVANSQRSSTSYLPSATVTWQPTPNVTVTNAYYYYHARRSWENAETYTFLGPNNGQTDANGNPIPDNVIARDRFHVFHNQNINGDRLDVAWLHRIFGMTNKLSLGFENYGISFGRAPGFPDALYVDWVDPFKPVQGSYGNFPGDFPSRGNSTKITDNAVLFEDALDITHRLKLVTGLRYEQLYLDRKNFAADGSFQPSTSFNNTYHPLDYRAGVVYNFTSFLSGYGQYSTGADPPGDDIFDVNANENFKLASSHQGEIGVKSIFPHQMGEATLAGYYIKRNDILSGVPGHPDQVQNVGSQTSKGIEFSLIANPFHNFSINFNAAYTHSRFGTFRDLASGNIYSGTQPGDVPSTTANLWLHLRQVAHTPFEVGGGIRFVGDRYADNGNLTKLLSYAALDAYVTYHFSDRLTLTGRGRNLTNKTYAQWTDIYYPTEVILGAPINGEIEFRCRF
jgi:iron complex outermembrane receptor protein